MQSSQLSFAESVYVSGKYAYVAAFGANRLTIVDISGIDAPAATIGDISAGTIEVTENVDVGNNLYVRNGVNIGPGGLLSDGPGSFSDDLMVGGNIQIGNLTSAKGITLFDTADGSAHCLRITSAALVVTALACP